MTGNVWGPAHRRLPRDADAMKTEERQPGWTTAFGVLRAPEHLDLSIDLDLQIKVVTIWPDQEAAAAKVARLNALPSSAGQRYWWQSTHLFAQRRPSQ